MGGKWPLTVSDGVLACDGADGVGEVTLKAPDGTVYAVNGSAGSAGAKDIGPIWASAGAGLKKDISPLIQLGLALCD